MAINSLQEYADERVTINTSGKHHGIALWPTPSDDPRDPLRWPSWFKVTSLLAAALFNFVANFAGAGPSVAIPLWIIQFHKSQSEINSLLTYNFLLLGVGNMFWVPCAVKFGKRPTLIVTMALLLASLIWGAKAKSYNSLLAARCVQGFFSAAGESIVPSVVSDLFFLHERAAMMSIYIILTTGGTAVGPLIAGYMIQYTSGGWRDFIWLSVALAAFNLLVLILFFRESNFTRPASTIPHVTSSMQQPTDTSMDERKAASSDHTEDSQGDNLPEPRPQGVEHVDHTPVSWPKIRFSFISNDKSVSWLKTFLHPFVFVSYAPVAWAIMIYGVHLSPQIILIFDLPSLLLAPPYLFSSSEVGLMQVAAIIGFLIGCFGGGWISDVITARLIVKRKGAVSAELRLISLLPGAWISPIACIIIAFAASKDLTWVAIAIGFGMLSFGTVFVPNIAITYVVDSYPQYAAECLVLINVVKNVLAFIFVIVAVDWIHAEGFVQVYMIMFMLVTLSILLAIPLYFYGPKLRHNASKSARHKWFEQ